MQKAYSFNITLLAWRQHSSNILLDRLNRSSNTLEACLKLVLTSFYWFKLSSNIAATFPLLSKMLDRVEAV